MFDAAPSAPIVPLQQSAGFEQALRSLGKSVQRLEDGTLVLRRRFGLVPVHMVTRPQIAAPSSMLSVMRALETKGPVIIAPEAPMPLERIGALPLVSPGTVAVLDVTPDHDTLDAGLHQKWRNRLRHARAQGLSVTRQNMPDDPQHWLLQTDLRQQAQRRYRNWPVTVTLAYGRENPGQAKLFTAHLHGAPVAAMLVLRHGSSATYHIGHADHVGRATSAHTLLMWRVIGWCKAKGIEQLDLGMLDTENAPGLARFKLGTGAQPKRLGGTWLWWPPLTPALASVARWDASLMQGR